MVASGKPLPFKGRFERLRDGFALLALAAATWVWSGAGFDTRAVRGLLQSGGFTAPQTQAALAMLDRAEAGGLPTSALANRIHEGMARHAGPATILGVLSDRVGDLEKADDIARRCAREGIAIRDRERSVLRLADSLSMGVTPGDVLSVLPAASKANRDLESVSRAGEVMGRLGQKGFPPSETRGIVASATAAGWTREQMDGLVLVFLEGQRLGLSKERLRQALADGIREKKEPSGLVDDLKRNAKAEAASSAPAESPDSGPASGTSGAPKRGKVGGAHGPAPGAKGPPPHPPVPRGPHH